jgi:hypothetical protein
MKRMRKIRRLGLPLVIAGGLAVSLAEASGAQETNAYLSDLRKVELHQPAPLQAGAQSGADSSKAESQKKDAPQREHRFWDKENDWLFAAVGASRTLDYFSTLNMRRRGRQEILLTNDVVDDHAAFAAIEASATGVSIGAAYLFHHYGHHKLERWTSVVHIGLATTGAVRNYCLKTAHFVTPGSP